MISLKTLKRNNTFIQQVDENVIFLIFFTCLTEFGSGQSFDIYSSSNFPTSCKIIMSDYKSWNCMCIDRQFEKGRKKSEEC